MPAPQPLPPLPAHLSTLPIGLDAIGPQGLSGECELTLLDNGRLRGSLMAFHEGDLAVDLRVPQRRMPLCVPLRQVQWLRMQQALPAPPGEDSPAAVPVRLTGPHLAPVQALCVRARPVIGGIWLDLQEPQGEVHRWFVHQTPQIRLETLS